MRRALNEINVTGIKTTLLFTDGSSTSNVPVRRTTRSAGLKQSSRRRRRQRSSRGVCIDLVRRSRRLGQLLEGRQIEAIHDLSDHETLRVTSMGQGSCRCASRPFVPSADSGR